MPNTESCTTCNGTGSIDALVSQHDDKTETVQCPTCKGKGEIHYMTDEEERNYWEDYW